MKAVRVMVAHSSEAVAAELKRVIESDTRMAVVGSARTGEEMLRAAALLKPTVVAMDLRFPDMGAGRIIRQLSQSRLQLGVLIVSEDAVKGSPLLGQAVAAGAFDYVLLPSDPAGIERIGRQVQTQIFVASFTKTKQIPQVDESQAVSVDAGLAQHARLDAMLVDCAAECVGQLTWLLPRIRPQAKATLLIVLRERPPCIQELIQETGNRLLAQAIEVQDGDELAPGRIHLICQSLADRYVARDPAGRVHLRSRAASRKQGDEPGPGARLLYRSLGVTYGPHLAVVALGQPTGDAADALVDAMQSYSLALVEENSLALLASIAEAYPGQPVPDDVVTMAQVDRMIGASI
jgi:two-component system chemotaxis response regulator CheB